MTSSFPVVDLKGNILGLTIYSPSLIIIAFIPAKLSKGEGGGGGGQRTDKRAGLDGLMWIKKRQSVMVTA